VDDNLIHGTPSPSKPKDREKAPEVYSAFVRNPKPLIWGDETVEHTPQKKKETRSREDSAKKLPDRATVNRSPEKNQPTEMKLIPVTPFSSPAKKEPAADPSSSYTGTIRILSLNTNHNTDHVVHKAEKTTMGIGTKMKELGNKVKNIENDPIAGGIALIIFGGALTGIGAAIGSPANPLGSVLVVAGIMLAIIGLAVLAVGFALKLIDLYGNSSKDKNKIEVEEVELQATCDYIDDGSTTDTESLLGEAVSTTTFKF